MKFSLSLLLGTCLLVGAANAEVLLSGDGVGESNSKTSANVVITPHPLWQQPVGGAQWISYTNSGIGGTVVRPDSTTKPQASFFESFSILGSPVSGFLTVWADDTAAVYVNDKLVVDSNPKQDSTCAAGPIGCEPKEGSSINLTPYLMTGSNTIRFDVFQQAGDVFGLLYQGGYEASQVPEPGTYALMGAGLGVLGLLRRKKS